MEDKRKSKELQKMREHFKNRLNDIYSLAQKSLCIDSFKKFLKEYLLSEEIINSEIKSHIMTLIDNDGKIIYELSNDEYIKIETIELLWHFINKSKSLDDISYDFIIDIYNQLLELYVSKSRIHNNPSKKNVILWMEKWPSGLNEDVIHIREENKRRIILELIKRIENRHSSHSKFIFEEGLSQNEKIEKVEEWWTDFKFHLAMAIKTPTELNKMLNNTLSKEVMEIYHIAHKKEIPIFVTPYYLSLLNVSNIGYDDQTIRSYVIYSKELVETFGNIHAWEKEDIVSPGKPNAAGWILPECHNVHRRYPDVAILIPETIGRACGGLCASCQRMYDFQSKHFNFDFENLKPKESWEHKLKRLMTYFEEDKQIRDILITGGDALMSQNSSLKNILDAIYKMAEKKKKDNLKRKNGEKYAEIQRIRLGSRLPIYLPMRINDELIKILKDFKEKAEKIGIKQFIVQTHFQTPLEVTPESKRAIEMILSAGWSVTNQLVFNVAASRRGHTAKLRKVLNEIGVICYYTFTVKGFNENYALFAPNSRSVQEEKEEKIVGSINEKSKNELLNLLSNKDKREQDSLIEFCKQKNIPFIATDRNVLNLPGIGKSMSFNTVGIGKDGKRILEFDHDKSRRHSPIIDKMGKVYIKENKSIYQYIEQLETMNEKKSDYKSLWNYTTGEIESRFPLFEYPKYNYDTTTEYSNLYIEE